MDPVNNQPTPNNNITPSSPNAPQGNLPAALKNKKVLIGIGGGSLLLVALFLPFLFGGTPNNKATTPDGSTETEKKETIATPIPQPTENPNPTLAAAMKKAVAEAQKEANEYNTYQEQLHTEYPWLRKLPLASPQYYVYFDLPTKSFIGKIYPKNEDHVDLLKEAVTEKLKTEKQIPVDKYPIKWSVYPQP